MCFEVMPELSCTHDDYIADFFHLGVELLRSGEDHRHKIHRELLLHCFVLVCYFLLDNQGSANC
jgi:hypothetical protein